MSRALPKIQINDKNLVPISTASEILGVSIDTVRRWDRLGKLKSVRPNGKDRYFDVYELEQIKSSKPLSISEVSESLKISPSTLRRLEKRGLIKPGRNGKGERTYNRSTLKKFIESEYWLQRKKPEGMVVDQFVGLDESSYSSVEDIVAEQGVESPLVRVFSEKKPQPYVIAKGYSQEKYSPEFRKLLYVSGLFSAAITILLFLILTGLFLVVPETTVKLLEYGGYRASEYVAPVETDSNVMGTKSIFEEDSQDLVNMVLGLFSDASLTVVKLIDEDAYRKALSTSISSLEDGEIFSFTAGGHIVPLLDLKFIESLNIHIPDTVVMTGLDSGQGEGSPESYDDNGKPKNLVIMGDNLNDGSVVGGYGGVILDNSITNYDLALSSVTTKEILNGTILNEDLSENMIDSDNIVDDAVGRSELADDAVNSERIADGEVKTDDLDKGGSHVSKN